MGDLLASVRSAAQRTPISGIISTANHGRQVPGTIPLWAGEGDLPTPRFIAEAAAKALYDGETFYTHSRGIPELREAIAGYYEEQFGRPFDPDTFFVTGSGMQAIQLCVAMTVGAGEDILIPTPSWPNAAGASTVIGANPVIVPMAEDAGRWVLTVEMLEKAMTPQTRAIFVNSPANPTGWTATREEMEAILAFARANELWIIADEIYSRFIWTGASRAPSFLDIAEPDDRILWVGTFSKNWAMTGWRMGWIHAPLALKQTLENLIQYSTSGTAVFMQRAGIAAITEGDWFVRSMIERAREGRDIVAEALAGRNRVTFAPPDGAFYAFFKVDGLESSRQAAIDLIDKAQVGTAPGTAFGENGEGYVRVCFLRSSDSLREAMSRIVNYLETLG
ncbi:pyridoxal phosphate-dependent aminotransferase [Acuticoccus yangtzensis]|uniref:pyridoxal phosphate-dependent aminotransferase n=1 Tax=Acuticoccus yangtzensis TaxID=1443441 RepID=UPI0009F7D383|nr:pyridoxal phosphate-dependent aminotransferase [Acuticoccus yangtzensis]ORE96665.1 aspartate aminotransferase [Stappia sp. 22II-S9-Z10]